VPKGIFSHVCKKKTVLIIDGWIILLILTLDPFFVRSIKELDLVHLSKT